jgi:tRNA-Thr(GGU) m(6)t(6)A37 methyltransferase TsaA
MTDSELKIGDPSIGPRKECGQVKFIGLVGKDAKSVKIFAEYRAGLQGLENYTHIILLYWFHLRDRPQERETLQVTPKRHPGAPQVGVFASRSPSRPNPIGLCVLELVEIKDCTLTVKGLDATAGSPVIDIKPYNPRADSVPSAKVPEWAEKGPTT